MAPLAPNDNTRKRRRYATIDNGADDDDALVSVACKRVRFELPSTHGTESTSMFGDAIALEVHESELYHDELDKEELWWSKCERAEIADFTRKLARGFKRQNPERVEHYLRVFDECSKTPSLSSSEFLENAKLGGLPVEVRGLECGFIPSVKAYRKQHAQEVLDTQAHLQKGRLSEAMCLRVLSARAIRSSRPSRVMARLMGEADADS